MVSFKSLVITALGAAAVVATPLMSRTISQIQNDLTVVRSPLPSH